MGGILPHSGPAEMQGGPSATHLHAADAHTQAGCGALCALRHVAGLLLLGRVVPVLPGPHLQVQDTGVLVLGHNVLQQEEPWSL